MSLIGIKVNAAKIDVNNEDGYNITYNIYNNGRELQVARRYLGYSGNLKIPETVTYNNVTRKVTSIEDHAFFDCTDLTSVTIPNTMISIEPSAFQGCRGLTSVTIGSGVTSIGEGTFVGCTSIVTVKSYITEPFNVTQFFSNETYYEATLYVPAGTKELYAHFSGWREFLKIEDIDESSTDPNGDVCATPTIAYVDGKLKFSCSTEGVTYVSEIKDTDVRKFYDSEVPLSATYEISVYATKEGWAKSNTATATLIWSNATFTETTPVTTSVRTVECKVPALVTSHGGTIAVQSEADGLPVAVYAADGQLYGSSIVSNGQATVSTNLQPGSIAIVKIGDKTVKVVVR